MDHGNCGYHLSLSIFYKVISIYYLLKRSSLSTDITHRSMMMSYRVRYLFLLINIGVTELKLVITLKNWSITLGFICPGMTIYKLLERRISCLLFPGPEKVLIYRDPTVLKMKKAGTNGKAIRNLENLFCLI